MSLKEEENIARTKYCAIKKPRKIWRDLRDIFFAQPFVFDLYATLSMLDFYGFFFLRKFFQTGALKAKNTLQCGMNKRFETNMDVTVNPYLILIIFSVSLTVKNLSIKTMLERLSEDIFEKIKTIPDHNLRMIFLRLLG